MKVNNISEIISYVQKRTSYSDYHTKAGGSFTEADRSAVQAYLQEAGHYNLSVSLGGGVMRVSGNNPNAR